jgi:hypothetical protein
MEEHSYQNLDEGGVMAMVGAFAFVYGIMAIIMIIGLWKIFVKAGKPGWASIIPIYGAIVFLEIVGKPAWWFILFLIPGVNVICIIIVTHRLSLSFGKDIVMTLLLLLLPFIGLPLLGFGDAVYVGPDGKK